MAFFTSRIRRIMPLYLFLIVSAAAFTVYLTRGGAFTFAQNVSGVVSMLQYGTVGHTPPPIFRGFDELILIGATWTLTFEWTFYLFVPMIAYISRRPLFAVVPAVILAAYAFFDPGKPGWIWYFFLPGIACAIIKILPRGVLRESFGSHLRRQRSRSWG